MWQYEKQEKDFEKLFLNQNSIHTRKYWQIQKVNYNNKKIKIN